MHADALGLNVGPRDEPSFKFVVVHFPRNSEPEFTQKNGDEAVPDASSWTVDNRCGGVEKGAAASGRGPDIPGKIQSLFFAGRS